MHGMVLHTSWTTQEMSSATSLRIMSVLSVQVSILMIHHTPYTTLTHTHLPYPGSYGFVSEHNKASLIYTTFFGKIFVYHNVMLPAIPPSNLLLAMKNQVIISIPHIARDLNLNIFYPTDVARSTFLASPVTIG